ncbi:MAG: NHL repeat-containing protein, partial [Oscillospiraceae bacterium]
NWGAEYGTLNKPLDMYIDKNDNIFIADTGNNRIVKMDKNMNVLAAFDNSTERGFNAPSSVFVDDDGGIFVADTDNTRIVKLSSKGKFVEEFQKPKSDLLPPDFVYNPKKIAVSSTGYLYAIKQQSLMSIDAYNNFRGYVGTTQVDFNLIYQIKKIFANKKQLILMEKPEPVSALSFDIADDGLIYVTTVDEKHGQLKKLNSVGKNIYPKKSFFGEMVHFKKEDIYKNPNFIDVCVDKDNLVYMLEEWSGKIYVYDAEGNNLVVFGGMGEGQSSFKQAVAIDTNSNNDVFVLDKELNCIKVFSQTYFMQTVREAIRYYNAGDYANDIKYWQEVVSMDENYNLANKGIAKSLYKRGDYEGSMEYYRIARDKAGYSSAFEKNRHQYFRDHFLLVLVLALFVIAIVVVIFVLVLKLIKRTIKKYYHII